MTPAPRSLALAVGLLLAPAIGAAQAAITGAVFVDRNANGARDPGEPGLGGAAVSNQHDVVLTDSTGRFRLPSAGTGVVFLSVPDGHRATTTFWLAVPAAAPAAPLGFGVVPTPPVREFSFVHASDTHISEGTVGRTRRLRMLADSLRPAFVLITGDLIRDALRVGEAEATGYYELLARELAAFDSPVRTVPGNHEIFGIERHLSLVSPTHPLYGRRMYRKYRGPDYYSFTHGGVHFVGLNTQGIADLWYHGLVDSVQLAWLEQDLAAVPPDVPVVTFNHIPFYSTAEQWDGYTDGGPAPSLITVNGTTMFRHTVANAAAVLRVLRARRHELALGGHIHAVERFELGTDGRRLRFHQSAATVGPAQAAGMRFPSGFTLYTVRDGVIDDGRFVRLDP